MKDKKNFEYVKPEIEEEPGYLYLYQPKYINFFMILQITLKLKKDTDEKSQIMIRITEFNRQWQYGSRDKKMEKDFFEALKNRMATGKWGVMPWITKYKRRQNEFE